MNEQELLARIVALEARIALLEARQPMYHYGPYPQPPWTPTFWDDKAQLPFPAKAY